MKNKAFYRFVVVFFIVWPLFTGCYSYISSKDPSFHKGMDARYFEALIDNGEKFLREKSTYKLTEKHELSVKRINSKNELGLDDEKNEALKAPLLLRFVWLSDVHMRQREIKLGSDLFTSMLDEIVPVSERNKAQEDFYWAVYLSQIEAINALSREFPVDFMIHTGDSVDTGSIEELYQFIYISNKLQIPWLNVVGNHDITIFGNYMARLGYGYDPFVIFYPVGTLGNFIWMHRGSSEPQISGYGRHLLPLPRNCKHEASLSASRNKKLVPTTHHGFDLGFNDIKKSKCGGLTPQICSYKLYDEAGDYATGLIGTSVPIRLIAINSTKKDKMGAQGSIDAEQRLWLKEQLLSNRGEINLVFMHHRPKTYEYDETKTILANHGNGVLVAFTGHVHPKSKYDVTWHPGENGHGFYELNTGAVMEYPQIGRLIELRGEPGGHIWLIARALWNSLMTVREINMLPVEEIKKVTTGCIDIDEVKRENIQHNIVDAMRCGYYGAYDDYLADRGKVRFWDRPETFDRIWKEANMIIEISHGNKVNE